MDESLVRKASNRRTRPLWFYFCEGQNQAVQYTALAGRFLLLTVRFYVLLFV